jgi:hypothetical protein
MDDNFVRVITGALLNGGSWRRACEEEPLAEPAIPQPSRHQ